MAIIVRIPGSLREWFNGLDEAVCDGSTVKECFDQIQLQYPDFSDRILDDTGEMTNVIVFLNGENISNIKGLDTPVDNGDEIGIIPLAAGG